MHDTFFSAFHLMKASEKEVTDAARESAGTHEADGPGRVGRNQAGSAADRRRGAGGFTLSADRAPRP